MERLTAEDGKPNAFADGVCPFGEDQARGAGCIRPAGHGGPHLVTPGDADDDA
ncbi:hypothetical protein [Streptomyces globisporus]|uniref:hypothetical protein n=1 Tax=Streptomyces globisporus TaxID=1908 RepID=UPI0037B48AF6